jgi:hypothetical protein
MMHLTWNILFLLVRYLEIFQVEVESQSGKEKHRVFVSVS